MTQLYKSGYPFIFMNAAGMVRDMTTLLHESGHMLHEAYMHSADIRPYAFRNYPSEVAEVASMSMELMSLPYWSRYMSDSSDLDRAIAKQFEDVLRTFPMVACIDQFQEWMYRNPDHSHDDRCQKWIDIYKIYNGNAINRDGYESHL